MKVFQTMKINPDNTPTVAELFKGGLNELRPSTFISKKKKES